MTFTNPIYVTVSEADGTLISSEHFSDEQVAYSYFEEVGEDGQFAEATKADGTVLACRQC